MGKIVKRIDMNILNVLVFSLMFLGCVCESDRYEEKYKNGNIKRSFLKDCNGDYLKYEHYSIDNRLAFELEYIENKPQKGFEGSPWVHLIWDKADHLLGDSINLKIDIVTPPLLTYKFVIIDDQSEEIEYENDERYYYSTIANDSLETFLLKIVYFYNQEKWVTVKKQISIHCEER